MINPIKNRIDRVSKADATMSNDVGTLYVVATPIGNLEDMTHRAIRVLSEVELIAAEDTRVSRKLLHHWGISTRLTACHEHNERNKARNLLRFLQQGKCIALISDAGTPLVSDPGYKLVHAAIENGIRVIPVPGACAAIAALSVAGLPTDSFSFEGFAPAKKGARTKFFEQRKHETRTLIFYEASHRIVASVHDMAAIFGPTRTATIARELTKKFETIRYGTLGGFCEEVVWQDPKHLRGEFVVLVQGSRANRVPATLDREAQRIMRILLRQLSTKQAAALAAEITGVRKQQLYHFALSAKDT